MTTDIRTAISSAVTAFKADTGQLPIRLQVSRDHLSELLYSEYEFPDGSTIPIDYVDDVKKIGRGVVRCIGSEIVGNEPVH